MCIKIQHYYGKRHIRVLKFIITISQLIGVNLLFLLGWEGFDYMFTIRTVYCPMPQCPSYTVATNTSLHAVHFTYATETRTGGQSAGPYLP